VFLGCLVENPDDWRHRPQLEAVCAELGAFPISPRRQKLRALVKIRPGRPLMLDYYNDSRLHRWIGTITAREKIDLVYIFSTAMEPYARAVTGPPRILDMVDVDSEKWAAYADKAAWPMAMVWAREARTLGRYERRAAAACDHTLLVTPAEATRFAELAPECRGRVTAVENGVDLDWFVPGPQRYPDPYPASGPWLALVGNMDYWPNSDAADWCARDILPRLQNRPIAPKLAIVGANPGPEVTALARLPGVLVTGRVPDVRPYLAHAAVVVAPLRIARGVQNKVLEGMAMGRPVVASQPAYLGIRAEPGRDLLVGDGAAALAAAVGAVLDGRHPGLGAAARAAIEQGYGWSRQLAGLDAIIARTLRAG